jgi:uncharacterized protein
MASSLLALIDDIATVLDDVAVLSKVAARKTAAVLGDDLALNAQQVAGVRAERELPVVWSVFKGSLVNKLILVPAALLISAIAPWAVMSLMMVGGLYLCFEGVEKLAHKFLHDADAEEAHQAEIAAALTDPNVDLAALEQKKVRGAIRTDFILSAEIIVIALGTVEGAAFATQVLVLAGIALAMTAGVYGLVAGIVKLDDLGLYLNRTEGESGSAKMRRALGARILRAAPYLMKGLSIAGMVAMFLVGGGILVHGVPWLHHLVEHLADVVAGWPGIGGLLDVLAPMLANAIIGVAAGAIVLLAVEAVQRARDLAS